MSTIPNPNDPTTDSLIPSTSTSDCEDTDCSSGDSCDSSTTCTVPCKDKFKDKACFSWKSLFMLILFALLLTLVLYMFMVAAKKSVLSQLKDAACGTNPLVRLAVLGFFVFLFVLWLYSLWGGTGKKFFYH